MPDFRETVEELEAADASPQRLFGGDGVRIRNRRRGQQYSRNLLEAARFLETIYAGRRPMYHLQEALSTSDFPTLFGDILDRQLLGAYREVQPVWQNYIKRGTVPDFRLVQRRAVDGLEGRLPELDELEEYPQGQLEESADTYKVRKYGKRIDLSWETIVNDDLDALRTLPDRLARGARRTEQYAATQLYVGAAGPRSTLYSVGNGNIITGNPALSVDGLQKGLDLLASMRDVDGEPILMDFVHLVIPPALQVTAENILQATLFRISQTVAGQANSQTEVRNWLQNRLRLWVDPYIPYVAQTNANTSWFLFADPNNGRAFGELGFLRGYEDPGLWQKDPDSVRVGGGGDPEPVSFDTDSRAYKVRHVLGSGLLTSTGGAKATAASNGSGV